MTNTGPAARTETVRAYCCGDFARVTSTETITIVTPHPGQTETVRKYLVASGFAPVAAADGAFIVPAAQFS